MSDLVPPSVTADDQKLPWRGYKLANVLPVLQIIASNNFEAWTWTANNACKYITVEIDTRDGGFVRLKDRDGNLLSLSDLEYQYRRASSDIDTTPRSGI